MSVRLPAPAWPTMSAGARSTRSSRASANPAARRRSRHHRAAVSSAFLSDASHGIAQSSRSSAVKRSRCDAMNRVQSPPQYGLRAFRHDGGDACAPCMDPRRLRRRETNPTRTGRDLRSRRDARRASPRRVRGGQRDARLQGRDRALPSSRALERPTGVRASRCPLAAGGSPVHPHSRRLDATPLEAAPR